MRILREPKNSLIGQYRKLLAYHQAELEFTDGALREVARIAHERGTGARGLRAVVEAVLEPVLFDPEPWVTYRVDRGVGAGRADREVRHLRHAGGTREAGEPDRTAAASGRQAGGGMKGEQAVAARVIWVSPAALSRGPNLGADGGVCPRPGGRRGVVRVGASIMGISHGEFVKYPRTPHLFGSRGTDDDKHLGEPSLPGSSPTASLIVEEKLDGTNVGVHFSPGGAMALQCRGHDIAEGMHPQYDLLKQWAAVKRPVLEADAGGPVHPLRRVGVRQALGPLPAPAALLLRVRHLRQGAGAFLDLERRLDLLEGTGIQTVPVVHRGPLRPGRPLGPDRAVPVRQPSSRTR